MAERTYSHRFTPLHRACWGNEQRHTDTVKAFLDAGVPHNHESKDGKACMQMTSNDGTKAFLLKWLRDQRVKHVEDFRQKKKEAGAPGVPPGWKHLEKPEPWRKKSDGTYEKIEL